MFRDLLGVLCFLGFLAGALATVWPRRLPEEARRRRVTAYLAYLLAVSLGVGFGGRDLYPFASWPLLGWVFPDSVAYTRLALVGADGREYQADYRIWHPVGVDELLAWSYQEFPRLDSVAKRSAAAFLLARANASAAAGREGRPISGAGRLGVLTAPYFLLHPRRWTDSAATPRVRFDGLRLYSDSWIVEERARDEAAVWRRLLYEYRSAP